MADTPVDVCRCQPEVDGANWRTIPYRPDSHVSQKPSATRGISALHWCPVMSGRHPCTSSARNTPATPSLTWKARASSIATCSASRSPTRGRASPIATFATLSAFRTLSCAISTCAFRAPTITLSSSSTSIPPASPWTTAPKIPVVATSPTSSMTCRALYARLQEQQLVAIEFISEPVYLDEGPNQGGWALYMRDPNGIIHRALRAGCRRLSLQTGSCG